MVSVAWWSHTQPLLQKVSTVMLHGVYKQEIYNISFDTGVRGREKLQTLGSKLWLLLGNEEDIISTSMFIGNGGEGVNNLAVACFWC